MKSKVLKLNVLAVLLLIVAMYFYLYTDKNHIGLIFNLMMIPLYYEDKKLKNEEKITKEDDCF
ncbi:hypothetical protein [Gemelliphila palaticanis]|uniref:Uncharacterized protein n=1 Tax=Gemelliphila palaticanis TaxID=81950 RepID=A0ABX2T285_9BACL|nr:hypothetical protein [Gemella palaticanis]MBF0715390.1 hypothetical protein [Gemella palaticanis]NYS47320.1 hypothetical protein [Gemella palaticanis]